MAVNKERGEFELVAGARRLVMRLTTNACAEVEEFASMTFDQIVDGINKGSVNAIRLLLWAAFRDRHPDVATDEVVKEFLLPNAKDWQRWLPGTRLPAGALTREIRPSLSVIGNLIDEAGGLTGVLEQIKAFMKMNADSQEQGGRPLEAQPEVPGTGVESTLTPSASV